mmetsp:Transcript_64104/g.105829  ORF Transcript_64104/g.105829 Transcript_64104/m.105829 type:complete len:234 (-) Transcript_64104:1002-1703(-)
MRRMPVTSTGLPARMDSAVVPRPPWMMLQSMRGRSCPNGAAFPSSRSPRALKPSTRFSRSAPIFSAGRLPIIAMTAGCGVHFSTIRAAVVRISSRLTGMLLNAISTTGWPSALAFSMKSVYMASSVCCDLSRRKMNSVSLTLSPQSAGLPLKATGWMGTTQGLFCSISTFHVLPAGMSWRWCFLRMVCRPVPGSGGASIMCLRFFCTPSEHRISAIFFRPGKVMPSVMGVTGV